MNAASANMKSMDPYTTHAPFPLELSTAQHNDKCGHGKKMEKMVLQGLKPD